MKADIEKILEKRQKQIDKRFAAIEKQLEKLKGGESKFNTQKSAKA
jgi:sugar-specific transcriptional regulator TrmB